MGNWIVPAILAGISFFAYIQGVDVFQTFLAGAKKGAQTAIAIAPTLIGMLTAVSMLRASGTIDCLGQIMRPVLAALGIPPDCAALVLLKPISGSGGLALGTEVMRRAGVDSYAGRVAAVMLGASETSVYTISLYAGSLGLRDTRYAVPAALIGDLTAFVLSAFFVRLLFGMG
ncbi:MAG: spore maturation protein [Butyricicoccus pullicaecorum]|nr:spore maturation protein [Butyricicoccus pullicaecorum]MDO4669143.1 spore maturation protein [Butyricicoccus pullicaecorum]